MEQKAVKLIKMGTKLAKPNFAFFIQLLSVLVRYSYLERDDNSDPCPYLLSKSTQYVEFSTTDRENLFCQVRIG